MTKYSVFYKKRKIVDGYEVIDQKGMNGLTVESESHLYALQYILAKAGLPYRGIKECKKEDCNFAVTGPKKTKFFNAPKLV